MVDIPIGSWIIQQLYLTSQWQWPWFAWSYWFLGLFSEAKLQNLYRSSGKAFKPNLMAQARNCSGELKNNNNNNNNPFAIKGTTGWWFGTCFIFPYIGNFIIPTDFHIFQRGCNHQPDHVLWQSADQTMVFPMVFPSRFSSENSAISQVSWTMGNALADLWAILYHARDRVGALREVTQVLAVAWRHRLNFFRVCELENGHV